MAVTGRAQVFGRPRYEARRPPVWAVAVIAVSGVLLTGAAAGYRPLAGVVAVGAVVVGLALLRYPVAAGALLAGGVPIIAGLKRGLVVPGFRLSEVAIIGVGALILVPLERRRAVPWRTFDWLALVYAVGTALLGWFDTVNRGAALSSSDIGTLMGPLQYLVLYRAVTTILNGTEHRRTGLRLLVMASPAVSLLAIAQQVNLPGVRSLLATITGTVLYGPNPNEGGATLTIPPRASGPFPFWHETGGYLMMIVLLIIGLLLTADQRVAPRRWLVAILVLDAAALVETATIAPILGALLGTVALGVWYGRSRRVLGYLVACGVLLGGAYFPLLRARSAGQFSQVQGAVVQKSPYVPQTIAYRLVIFKTQDVPLLRGRWLTGYGPSLPASYGFAFTESLYFTLLLRGGVILLAIYLAMMWALFMKAKTAEKVMRGGDDVVVARVSMLVLVLLLVVHFIEGYFVDTGPADVIWVLAALLARPSSTAELRRLAPRRRRSQIPAVTPVTAGGAA